jgi:hypothetical protein
MGVFPVRYEYHLRIKKCSYPRNGPWKSISALPVRYERHLHIKN